jgi:integrase
MAVSYEKNPKTKKWSVRAWWVDEKGERCSLQKGGFETKKTAELWAGDKINIGQASVYRDAHKVTLGDFLNDWLKVKEKTLSPTTMSGYRVNAKKIKGALGNTLVQELRLDMIQKFINDQSEVVVKTLKHILEIGSGEPEIEEITAAPNTVKYTFRTLHSALEYAIKVGIIKYNPADHIDLPPERDFAPNTLGASDILTLLEKLKACEHEIYFPVLLSVMHGLRRGEALGLRWSDIDFETGTMHICNNYTIAENKMIHKSVKTKDSAASIPLIGFVADELQQIRASQKNAGELEIYVCAHTGVLPDPRHISAKLNRFQRANKLPLCRFHDLRHSFAGIALDSGTDLDTLKRLMRHSKIAMTSRYLHNNVSREKKASQKIEKMFLKKKG